MQGNTQLINTEKEKNTKRPYPRKQSQLTEEKGLESAS